MLQQYILCAYEILYLSIRNINRDVLDRWSVETDEDMTHTDTPIKVKDKASSFLYLPNDRSKNLLLPNVVACSTLRNDDDDDVNLVKKLSITSTIDDTWIQHAQDPSWSASSLKIKIQSLVAR